MIKPSASTTSTACEPRIVEKFALVANVSGRRALNTAIITIHVSTRPERSSAGARLRRSRGGARRRVGRGLGRRRA